MYRPRDIIETIAGNLRRTRNPFGIPNTLVNRWWKDADLPKNGEALLFTGLMYQFVPYIETATGYLAKFEDTPWAEYLRYARWAPSTLSGLGLALITPGRDKRKFNRTLQNIARILTASRASFYYRPELDQYSGVLLYDLGDQKTFENHAHWVARRLTSAGVKKLITVDPHTTYALKELYPKITGAHFEVTPYFEKIRIPARKTDRTVTLHDPCFYGRYLGLSDVPARALAALGIQCRKVEQSGAFTHCCGGPAESISPKLAGEVGGRRLAQLSAPGAPIVAMCPICLGNLRKLGADVEDLSSILAENLAA
ncbi:MAG: (Fe-S)-binding protein [Desulfobacteraceae bacterium]|nr:(Fe-S)-binding protein [Desulfobacteraceae bacterium]